MDTLVAGMIIVVTLFLGLGWFLSRESPEDVAARECFEKWKNHSKFEWLVYSLGQLPKFLKHKLNVKDKTQISNLRKAVDLFGQIDEIGFINDLKIHGDKLIINFNLKSAPFFGMENVTLAEGLNGTTVSYLIISTLKGICPYLDVSEFENVKEEKENKKLIGDILSLIEEIKKSNIVLSQENRSLFNKEQEEILKGLNY